MFSRGSRSASARSTRIGSFRSKPSFRTTVSHPLAGAGKPARYSASTTRRSASRGSGCDPHPVPPTTV